MRNYESLVDATNDLLQRGYTANLSIEGDTVDDKSNNISMTADEFSIDEFYRFEGASNPSDMSIIYAVSAPKYDLKGIIVDAYGTYANNGESAVHAKLHHHMVSNNLHSSDRPTA